MIRCGVLLLLLGALGCQRSTPVAPAGIDYRKLNPAELVALIQDKLRVPDVALTADGPNQYKGTLPSPDGTIRIPVAVTVDAERITLVSTGGGMTTRQVITPQGVQSDLR